MNPFRRVAARTRTMPYEAMRIGGFTAAMRAMRQSGPILCYHNVVPEDAPAWGEPGLHMSIDRFDGQIRWLARRYAIVALDEFVNRLMHGRSMKQVAAITFDDAYAGVFAYAIPFLEAMRLPSTVFVATAFARTGSAFWWDRRSAGACVPAMSRAATWSTIRDALSDRTTIGAHSATHRLLPALSDSEVEDELTASREQIQWRTGIRPQFIAYPFGACDRRVARLARACGYQAAFALDGLVRRGDDLWTLRRVNVPSGITDAAFEAWTCGLNWPQRLEVGRVSSNG